MIVIAISDDGVVNIIDCKQATFIHDGRASVTVDNEKTFACDNGIKVIDNGKVVYEE